MFFVETLNVPEIPREKVFAAIKQINEKLKSARLHAEYALEKSLEFAKNFKVR